MYKIYISSAAGLSYTGISCQTEQEAKGLCDKYNKQDPTPYACHVYRKVQEVHDGRDYKASSHGVCK